MVGHSVFPGFRFDHFVRFTRFAVRAAFALVVLSPCAGAADAPLCSSSDCGLASDGAYPNLVVGRLARVGGERELRQVQGWAMTHGYWQTLPRDAAPYLRDIRLVTITVPADGSDHAVTLFMQEEEFASAPLQVGDFVRYAPHDPAHEVPKGDADGLALYHGLTGCVALLCRRDDADCAARYRPGIYTAAQGRPVDLASGAAVADGAAIDPQTLLPLQTHNQ